MNIKEIVDKLIGPINPIGETKIDENRFVNLEVLKVLIEDLLQDVIDVSRERDHYQYSNKRAGGTAYKFMKSLKNELRENLEESDRDT